METIRSRSVRQVEWPNRLGLLRISALLAACAVYVLFLESLGHAVVTSIMTFVVLQVMEMRSWPLKIAVSLLFGFGSYYLFVTLLDVPLPGGLWMQ